MPLLKPMSGCQNETKRNQEKGSHYLQNFFTKRGGFAIHVWLHMILFIRSAGIANVDIVGSIFV